MLLDETHHFKDQTQSKCFYYKKAMTMTTTTTTKTLQNKAKAFLSICDTPTKYCLQQKLKMESEKTIKKSINLILGCSV